MLERQWFLNGQNYARTHKAWLHNHDQQHKAIMSVLQVRHCTHCCTIATVSCTWQAGTIFPTNDIVGSLLHSPSQIKVQELLVYALQHSLSICLQDSYGPAVSRKQFVQCRLVYVMMAELFKRSAGKTLGVAHVLYRQTARQAT